jgi:hypothetical protein
MSDEEAFVQIGERKCLLDAQLRLNVHATFGNNVVLLRIHPDVAIVPLDADGRTSLPLRSRDDFRLECKKNKKKKILFLYFFVNFFFFFLFFDSQRFRRCWRRATISR